MLSDCLRLTLDPDIGCTRTIEGASALLSLDCLRLALELDGWSRNAEALLPSHLGTSLPRANEARAGAAEGEPAVADK
jgi:hypothetical protein